MYYWNIISVPIRLKGVTIYSYNLYQVRNTIKHFYPFIIRIL